MSQVKQPRRNADFDTFLIACTMVWSRSGITSAADEKRGGQGQFGVRCAAPQHPASATLCYRFAACRSMGSAALPGSL